MNGLVDEVDLVDFNCSPVVVCCIKKEISTGILQTLLARDSWQLLNLILIYLQKMLSGSFWTSGSFAYNELREIPNPLKSKKYININN